MHQPRLIDASALEAAFSFADGFHHVDWKFTYAWIEQHIATEDFETALSEAVQLWLGKLRDDLGGNYFILQSKKTFLLCDLPLEQAQWILRTTGDAADTIKLHLGKTAWSQSSGKDVALVFAEQDDYYQYLSHFGPDGEQASSGGVCIHSGYTHIALPWHDPLVAINTIVHELTHDCLTHLPLPHWLNEGVAVTLEKAIAPVIRPVWQSEQSSFVSASMDGCPPIMWDELAERHFAFWNETNIQSFWAGTSFFEPGDANELSYSLAEVFLKLLSERGRPADLQAFLEGAHSDDAGQTAAHDILNTDLGDIAGTFLGPGNWRPQRAAMVRCWEAAGWSRTPETPAS